MSILKENNNILMGLMIGVTVPVLGYFAIETIFDILTKQGLMDSVTVGSAGKRMRTLALMAICCNIIPIQLLNNRRVDATLKGVLIATFIYCAVWLIKFGPEIL